MCRLSFHQARLRRPARVWYVHDSRLDTTPAHSESLPTPLLPGLPIILNPYQLDLRVCSMSTAVCNRLSAASLWRPVAAARAPRRSMHLRTVRCIHVLALHCRGPSTRLPQLTYAHAGFFFHPPSPVVSVSPAPDRPASVDPQSPANLETGSARTRQHGLLYLAPRLLAADLEPTRSP